MSRSVQDRIIDFIRTQPGAVPYSQIRFGLCLEPDAAKQALWRLRDTGRLTYRHGEGDRIAAEALAPTYPGTMLDVLMPRTIERTVRCRKVKGALA